MAYISMFRSGFRKIPWQSFAELHTIRQASNNNVELISHRLWKSMSYFTSLISLTDPLYDRFEDISDTYSADTGDKTGVSSRVHFKGNLSDVYLQFIWGVQGGVPGIRVIFSRKNSEKGV